MVITRGDTLRLKMKYMKKDKTPIVLSNESYIKFTVKDTIDGQRLFQKKITIENYDDVEECYIFIIQPDDTKNVNLQGLDKVDYLYDFELTDNSNGENIVRTLNKGKFTIKYDITTM